MAAKLRMALAMVAMVIVFVAGTGMCDTVSIENDMGHGVVLGLQCSSGTEDLGFQTIYSGLSYVFSFQPSWWGRDVYQCNFHTKVLIFCSILGYQCWFAIVPEKQKIYNFPSFWRTD